MNSLLRPQRPLPSEATSRGSADLDPVWRAAPLVRPEYADTWPLVSALMREARRRLEVSPGLRPRLPLAGTHVVDARPGVLARLRDCGAQPTLGRVTALPFPDASFDLLGAYDVLAHVADDTAALAELARVAAPRAVLMLSVPLHPKLWSAFDAFAGRLRRYEPPGLLAKLAGHGFIVEQSAARGAGWRWPDFWPSSPQSRRRAPWWYHRLLRSLADRLQPPLRLQSGLVDAADAATLLLVCRKSAPRVAGLSRDPW
jgi:SAM-dependent methyltransferase